MIPYALVYDDFLQQFVHLRTYADQARFEDVQNPVDGVTYPHICPYIPDGIQREIEFQIFRALGTGPIIKAMFMRLSPAATPVPHVVHTDLSMGQFSLMLYLNREVHCQGGTSLMRHRATGMTAQPRNADEQAIWERDHNTRHAWLPVMTVPMAANRAFIFPAQLMHRAEPIGGFGTNQFDARLVLTAFFNLPS